MSDLVELILPSLLVWACVVGGVFLRRWLRRRRAEKAYRAVVDQTERARVLRSLVATDYRKFTRKP